VDSLLKVPAHADTRDVKAIKRLTTAYLKLLFPHVQTTGDIDINEFKIFCFNQAYEKRAIIRKQIHQIDGEFKADLPNIEVQV
jgi:ATP-dependent Lon protease